jgi:hypothetical protein
VCIVLFLPVAVVLGSNPFCLSSQEQNDSFSTPVFGLKAQELRIKVRIITAEIMQLSTQKPFEFSGLQRE